MQLINIDATANQSFSVRLNNVRYDITIKESNGVMVASIVRDGVSVISGSRIVTGELIIPSKYQEDGNFFIDTLNEEIPYWTSFGLTQFLYYFTSEELEAARGG